MLIEESVYKLEKYLASENFKGYDPYDTLNSWFPFHWFGNYISAIATQFQKRNQINIRPLLGIKKEINPKAFGLFLHAYSKLYIKTGNKDYLKKTDYFFNWLKDNYSHGYSGYCWGYNFPWANPQQYKPSYTPSSVVTGFICKGLSKYLEVTNRNDIKDIILSASKFILHDIPITEDENGICFSYTPLKRDLCFNSSLLAAEILVRAYLINAKKGLRDKAIRAVDWVISHQKNDGHWNYSIDIKTGTEREQLDFHQGYLLDSIFEIKKMLKIENENWERSIKKGLIFYRNSQFTNNGISYWRFPKKWPVEIHNQSQGIITFLKLSDYDEDYKRFAEIIANWTIKNMQDNVGYFYYQKYPLYKNKISYIRWSNAWMFLALTYLTQKK